MQRGKNPNPNPGFTFSKLDTPVLTQSPELSNPGRSQNSTKTKSKIIGSS